MIVSLTNILNYLDVDVGYFTVNASHDKLILAYDGGSATSVEVDEHDSIYSYGQRCRAIIRL